MTTRTAIALEEISDIFSYLSGKVKLSNKIGKTDINRDLERYFIYIFNKIYKLKLNNLNHEISNYPAIDLGDTKEGVCIQVTSTSTSSKLKETIRKFKEHKLDEDYSKLIFFILSVSEKCKCKDSENEIDVEVINLLDLYMKISQMREDSDIRDLHRHITQEITKSRRLTSIETSGIDTHTYKLDSIQRLIKHLNFEKDKESRDLLEKDIEAFAETLYSLNEKQREVIYWFIKKSNFVKSQTGKIRPDDIYMSSLSARVEFTEKQNIILNSLIERGLLEVEHDYELPYEDRVITALFLRFRGELDMTNLFGQLKLFCNGKDKKIREIFLHGDYACLAL